MLNTRGYEKLNNKMAEVDLPLLRLFMLPSKTCRYKVKSATPPLPTPTKMIAK
jgi:hypothetical protein